MTVNTYIYLNKKLLPVMKKAKPKLNFELATTLTPWTNSSSQLSQNFKWTFEHRIIFIIYIGGIDSLLVLCRIFYLCEASIKARWCFVQLNELSFSISHLLKTLAASAKQPLSLSPLTPWSRRTHFFPFLNYLSKSSWFVLFSSLIFVVIFSLCSCLESSSWMHACC